MTMSRVVIIAARRSWAWMHALPSETVLEGYRVATSDVGRVAHSG